MLPLIAETGIYLLSCKLSPVHWRLTRQDEEGLLLSNFPAGSSGSHTTGAPNENIVKTIS